MQRRKFITLLGGAAASWPLTARAQQQAVMPVIGVITGGTESDVWRQTAFRQGLAEAGYIEGQSVAVEYRWAEGRLQVFPELVADLLRRQVTVIATLGSALAARAAKAATATVPIVFSTGQDPVEFGLVASLARPGGNLTGVNFLNTELATKQLGLVRELLPAATRVAVLVNPANITAETTLREVEPAAKVMGLHIQVVKASNSSEINAAFASLGRERPDALFVAGDTLFVTRRVQLANLASRHAIPAIYSDRLLAEVGGLISYRSDVKDAHRQVGVYVGRILKGTKPADLPVVQAKKFELIVNAETARMLGLTIPPSLLAIADEVIE
jgi:putative ABC transport system substrate-binding protein